MNRKALMLSLFFMAVLLISMSEYSVQAQAIPFEGEGTKASPYLIQDADDMISLSALVNSGTSFSQQYFIMTNDIDMQGIDFSPIGTNSSKCFSGTFDGCNYKITNLSITYSGGYCGLFGYVSSGTLYRMDVSGTITNTCSGTTNTSIGLVAGYLYYGSIYGVTADGTLTGPNGSNKNIGMIAGKTYLSKIRSGHASGTINMNPTSSSYSYNVGGLIGYSSCDWVENCDSSVVFSSDGSNSSAIVGGIIGCVEESTDVYSCTLKGNITMNESAWKVGGIVGELGPSGKVKNCLVEKRLEVTQTNYPVYVGGIVAYSNGSISNCIYTGQICTKSASNTYAGGIAGYCGSGGVSCCVVTGTVIANKETGKSPTYYVGAVYGSLGNGGAGTNKIRAGVLVHKDGTPTNYEAGTSTYWYDVYEYSGFWDKLSTWPDFDLDTVWGMKTTGPYLRNIIKASSVEILNGTEFTIPKSGTVQLKGYVLYPDTAEKCKYTSTNTGIAKVDAQTGLVTGVAEGTAYINVVTDGAGAKETMATITVVDNDVSNASIELNGKSFTYNGNPIEPVVSVKMGDITLVQGVDYTVAYTDNIEVGTATVTVTGKNPYKGTCSETYTISKGQSSIYLDASYATEYEYSGSQLTAPSKEQIHCTNSEQTVTCKWYSGDVTTGSITASPLTSVTNAGVYTLVLKAVANTHYEAAECRTLVLINPVALTVALPPTASAISYGQSLADSSFSGGMVKFGSYGVGGTWAFCDTTICPAVSDSKTTQFQVEFTPTSSNYLHAYTYITLNINPATISESLPSTIYVDYKTTKVPASLLEEYTGWSVAASSVGIALEVGVAQTITAQYYDTDNYSNAVRNVNVIRNSCKHDEKIDKTEREEPTCTEQGHIEYWKCSVCNMLFADEKCQKPVTAEETVLSATGHAYSPQFSWSDNWESCSLTLVCSHNISHTETKTCTVTNKVTRKADCKYEGVKRYTAAYGTYSDTQDVDIPIDKTNHTGNTEIRNATKENCKKAGYTGDTYCTDCGELLNSGVMIPATGKHSFSTQGICGVCGIHKGIIENKDYPLEIVYSGSPVTPTAANFTINSSATPSFIWYKGDLIKAEELPTEGGDVLGADAPSEVGTYTLVVVADAVDEEEAYTAGELRIKVVIADGKFPGRADIISTAAQLSKNWDGQAALKPEFETTSDRGTGDANVTFEYKKSTDTEYSSAAPSDAGTYDVRVIVKEDATHTQAVSEPVRFTIAKIDPCYTVPTGLTAKCGDKVSAVSLQGTGFEWMDADVVLKAGSSENGAKVTKKAKYVPEDTTNYNVVENIDIEITVTHTWDEGKVTKEATETAEGEKTYKCKCGTTRTEAIPKKEATPPKKGDVVKDDKGTAMYEVTDVTGNKVVYKAPAKKSTKTITIPSTVTINDKVYKVTAIGKDAFAGCKKLTKVTIGKNVKTIGTSAFSGCSKLKTVSMGSNVTAIGDKAFYKCTALEKITIPSKVKRIGKQAFYGCKKLKTITIKTTKLTSSKVGSKAFKGIYSKASIKVPKSKLKSYKKILRAKGVSSKAKIKK